MPTKRENKLSSNKILFVVNSLDVGGAENVLFNILKDKNHKETLIISLTKLGCYGLELKNQGYQIYVLNMKKNISCLLKIIELIYLIIKFKPLIVHTWLYHANLIGGVLAKIAGVKKIFWSIHHDFEYSNLLGMFEMKILSILSYYIPNKIVYCSKSSKINHIKNGFNPINSLLIENGVSLKTFYPNNKLRNDLRNKYKITDDCLFLSNVARYHPIKDHNNLFKSLQILDEIGINFKCMLIGKDISYLNKILKYQIYSLGLERKIIIYGQSSQIEKLMNAFDINILASKKESFPLTLLESMACGVPCISTNVGDAKYIIGKAGWLVNAGEPKAIANCIMKIIKDKKTLRKKSIMARKRVENKFCIENMKFKYNKIY